jgi:tetratricopeptide (TPR) repeat protein
MLPREEQPMAVSAPAPSPEESTERYAEAVAMRMAAAAHRQHGDGRKALACLATAREMFGELGQEAQVAWTMLEEGGTLSAGGRAEDALVRLDEAEAAFARLDAPRGRALAACRAGDALRRLGRPDEARERYGAALDLARPVGDAEIVIACLVARAGLLLASQAYDAAGRDLAEALALRQAHIGAADSGDFLLAARLARWARAAGQAETAAAHAAEARRLADELDLERDRSDPEVAAELRPPGG